MALNPTPQDKRGIVLRGDTGFLSTDPTGSGGSEPEPPTGSQQVTVTGSGFGLEPNVVFYRTFKEGVDGQTVQEQPPEGEVGAISEWTAAPQMTYGTVAGKKCLLGFDNGTKLANQILFPATSASDDDAIQSFNWYVEESVPVGSLFPGNNTNGLNEFPSDSGSKSIWFVGDDGGNSTDALPDIAIPQHGGGGAHYVWGNSINYRIYPFGGGGPNEHDFWDWDGWNTFNQIQRADPNDPQNTVYEQVHYFTSELSGGQKPTKTYEYSRTEYAAFAGNYTGPDSDCHYRIIRINSYSNRSDVNPELTQLAYGTMYLASSSPQGTENYRQMVFLGDAATLGDCGKRKPKIADSWSDTSVTVSVTSEEAAEFTHVLVYKADKSVSSEPIA